MRNKTLSFLVMAVLTFSLAVLSTDVHANSSLFQFPSVEVEESVNRGEIVVNENPRKLLGGIGYAIVEAQPDAVWEVVTDYSGHPSYLSSITRSVPKQISKDQIELYTEYKTPWPFSPLYMKSIVNHKSSSDLYFRMSWQARETNMKTCFGNWQVIPYEGKTLLIHEMNYDVKFIPQALAANFSRQAIKHVMATLRDRAQGVV